MYFLSGNLSGILILRKSWMHFSSSSSTVSFSFTGLFLEALESRSKSLFRRGSDFWIMVTGPFFRGLSRVWTLAWGCCGRATGPQMTVSWGEQTSEWLSELEVERSFIEVPLSPSPSPLWFLQQQSHGGEDQRDGPPEQTEKRGCFRAIYTPSFLAQSFRIFKEKIWDSDTKRGRNKHDSLERMKEGALKHKQRPKRQLMPNGNTVTWHQGQLARFQSNVGSELAACWQAVLSRELASRICSVTASVKRLQLHDKGLHLPALRHLRVPFVAEISL